MDLLEVLKRGYDLVEPPRVWRPRGQRPAFNYSDGDAAENRLTHVLAQAADLSIGSTELTAAIQDWTSQYHLSAERANLLRPLVGLLSGAVLEVGAGCGAVTRFLGESGANVLALEGSARRARLAASRCRDLPNVAVVEDSLLTVDFADQRFDVVTLIGVLEYGRLYAGRGDDGIIGILQACRHLLKPDGVLLLAIENQLGLKYFAGAPEDHLGLAFAGLNDNYTPQSVVTFGKRQLQRLLTGAGLASSEFLYPLPDYKLPEVVLTEQAFEHGGPLIENIVSNVAAANQATPYARTLAEEMTWPLAVRNGVGPDLANSFLVVARPHPQQHDALRGTLACVYSTRRRKAFVKETLILSDTGERQLAKRRRLYPDHAGPSAHQLQRVEDEVVAHGPLLSRRLLATVNRPGWSAAMVASCVRPWHEYLRRHLIEAAPPLLPGGLLDCVPFNLIETGEDALVPIDLEWSSDGPLPLGYVLWRGLMAMFSRLRSVAEPEVGTPGDLPGLTAAVLGALGVAPFSEAEVQDFRERELKLQQTVVGPHFYDVSTVRMVRRVLLDGHSAMALQARVRETEILSRQRQEEVERLREDLGAHERAGQALRAEFEGSREAQRLLQDQVKSLAARSDLLTLVRLTLEIEHARQKVENRRHLAMVEHQGSGGRWRAKAFRTVRRNFARAFLTSELRLVEASGLFDLEWYRASQPDIGAEEPLVHFLRSGGQRGHSPGPLFDAAFYLRANPDVARASINPLVHYLRYGAQEGRDPHPLLSHAYYASRTALGPDTSALLHFLRWGAAQRLDPHPLFCTGFYVDQCPELERSGQNPLAHYLRSGARQGLDPHPAFSTRGYYRRNPEVERAGINALVHFAASGAAEGRHWE